MKKELSLGERVQRLEDIEEIKQLKSKYMQACDDHYNPEKIASYFTEDAVWTEKARSERLEGKEAIYQYFKETSKNIVFALHYAIAPIITVDKDTADGQWYMWMVSTAKTHGAVINAVTYKDKYVKIDGSWMFKEMHVTNVFVTKYEDGWEKGPFSGL